MMNAATGDGTPLSSSSSTASNNRAHFFPPSTKSTQRNEMESTPEDSSTVYISMPDGNGPHTTHNPIHIPTTTTNTTKSQTRDGSVVSFDMTKSPAHHRQELEEDDNDEEPEDKNDGIHTIVSSILTADGIADRLGFTINCLVVFIGDMARGIFFPTMWNLVRYVGGDQITLGYVIASFSFGRMLVLPLFGSWSIRYGYRFTLMVCTGILWMGSILFIMVAYVRKEWFLIMVNTIMGVGSGTLGVTLAYAAEVTPKRKRTIYMAWVTAVQYAGTTATPFIGAGFVVWCRRLKRGDVVVNDGEDEEEQDDGFEGRGYDRLFGWNEFTAPAYFMMMMCTLTMGLLYAYFTDRPRYVPPKKVRLSSRQEEWERLANSPSIFGSRVTLYEVCLYGCMFLNAVTKGPMSCFETLGIEFAESHFDIDRATAGMIVATMGTIGVLNLLSMGTLAKYFDDTELTSGGVIFFIFGILMNTFLDRGDSDNPTWRYYLSFFFSYSIGYPICHTALIGLFSKIVGRRPQGTLQGWFSASGSVARISFPILAGYVVGHRDIETLFYILVMVLVIALLFLAAFRQTLSRLAL